MSEEMMNGMMEKNEQRGCEMENGGVRFGIKGSDDTIQQVFAKSNNSQITCENEERK